MADATPLHVGIDSRTRPGFAGGAATFVGALAQALCASPGLERYTFLTAHPAWPRAAREGCENVMAAGDAVRSAWWKDGLKSALPIVPRLLDRLPARLVRADIRASDGTFERLACDVVHFPTQGGFLTRIPSVYQPWDLQYLHFPQFFSARQRALLEARHLAYSRQAAVIVVPAPHVKRDVIDHLGVPAARVVVVPIPAPGLPAVTTAAREAARHRFGIVSEYALYPAQTWPHKNHDRLLAALAQLRDRAGLPITLVCTGAKHHAFDSAGALRAHGLEDRVIFTGFVPDQDLASLYADARLMVFPSLYEGWGLPVLEAMAAGLPVACSAIEPLRSIGGDAVLGFDPLEVHDIAEKVSALWSDADLRRRLAVRGRERAAQFDWADAVADYRAVYRIAAGVASAADQERFTRTIA